MVLVERHAVQRLESGGGGLQGLVLTDDETHRRVGIRANRHVLLAFTILVDKLGENTHELVKFCLTNFRQTTDEERRGEGRIQLDCRLQSVNILTVTFRDEVEQVILTFLFEFLPHHVVQ